MLQFVNKTEGIFRLFGELRKIVEFKTRNRTEHASPDFLMKFPDEE